MLLTEVSIYLPCHPKTYASSNGMICFAGQIFLDIHTINIKSYTVFTKFMQ